MKHEDYTVGWICALPTEIAAAVCMLDEIHEPLPTLPADDNSYTLGQIGHHNVVIAGPHYGVMGVTSAARVAEQMLRTFTSVRFGLMVGIGGGVPSEENDIHLGDVVVSKPSDTSGGVIQYDYGKSVQGGHFTRTGSLNRPPDVLLKALRSLYTRHMYEESRMPQILADCIARYPPRRQACTPPGRSTDRLFHWEYDHVQQQATCVGCDVTQIEPRPPRPSNHPTIHYGIIASGNQVMKDGKTRERLRQELSVMCFEMEAAGLMDRFPCLVVRGICDYADSHNNKQWQDYAAATAAAYTKELLQIIPYGQVTSAPCANTLVAGQSSGSTSAMSTTFHNYGQVGNQAGTQNFYGTISFN